MQIIPCRADRFLKSQDSDLLEPIVVPAVDNESQIIVADQADLARVYKGIKIDGTQGHLHRIIEPDADIADDIQPLRTELNQSDIIDRASSEADRALELRARERQRKLISKIDAALARLDEGTYGFCEETGEPIALSRLEARPIATLSVEAQERHERKEKQYRADD